MTTGDLALKLRAAGFTPGKKDVAPLVDLVATGDDASAEAATRGLARVPALATGALIERLPGALDAAAVRLVHALGVVARTGDATARDAVVAVLADPAAPARARREAAIALGKLGGDAARAALVARWDEGALPADHRRALVEALGKVGGADALARIAAVDAGEDAELARRRDRAVLMIERTGARDAASEVDLDATPPAPVALRLRCRAGLEDLLAAELSIPTTVAAPGVLTATLAAPLRTVVGARTLLDVGVVTPLASDGDLAGAIADALCAPPTVALLAALTRGPVRWRLDFAEGGHRRGVVWRAAQAVRARCPTLLNDPTATTWDVVVDADRRALELVPRRRADERFAWRVADVPAASHPTIAAALARLAGPGTGERIWDPFAGSGAELVERALLAPPRELIGTDLDPRALDAARANLAAAGLAGVARLIQADARSAPVRDVDLVITNPPLGRRLRGDPAALLIATLPAIGRALVPGGRLVWITPLPARTAPAATAAGLALAHRRDVDLGGFTATIERWTK